MGLLRRWWDNRWWKVIPPPTYTFAPIPMLRWCDTHGDAIHIFRPDEGNWLCRKCMVARMMEERP